MNVAVAVTEGASAIVAVKVIVSSAGASASWLLSSVIVVPDTLIYESDGLKDRLIVQDTPL